MTLPLGSADWIAGYEEARLRLIGRAIDAIVYYDPIEFEEGYRGAVDSVSGAHTPGWGLDLVLGDQHIGFTWDWDGDDYRLTIRPRGLGELMNGNERGADASHDPEWQLRVGKRVESMVFSVHTGAEQGFDKVSDCRICFVDAPPVWITARYENPPHHHCGDNIVVFFEEEAAKLAGVSVETRLS